MLHNGIHSASHGLRALQKKIDAIGHNVANVNTTGFKSKDVVFGEMLYRQMYNQPPGETAGQQGRTTEEMIRRGSGLIVTGAPTSFALGMRIDTGAPTDVMIEGTGFFRVARDLDESKTLDPHEYRYTRNGAFQLTPFDDVIYLTTASREYVLDEDDDPIVFAVGSTLTISPDGTLMETTADGEENVLGRMGIHTFPNLQMLIRDGNGNWMLHPDADPATNDVVEAPEGSYMLVQGAIEGSNVDLTKELTDLITTQRLLSLTGRALTMSDEMLGMANDLVRR